MRYSTVVILAALSITAGVSHAAEKPPESIDFAALDGWAARLVPPGKRTSSRRLYGKDTASIELVEKVVSPPLLFAKYIFSEIYELLFKDAEQVKIMEPIEELTPWKDTAPRFIVYGDGYTTNSSLGLPDPLDLQGVTHYLLPFWTTKEGVTDSMLEWTHGSATQRMAIVREYNKHGIRLGMSTFFSDTGKPNAMATRMAKFARKYQFQGVNIDYKDYDLFERGNASAWVIPLARRLRSELPGQEGFFLSHAPIAPLFNSNNYTRSYSQIEASVGEAIDFYSVQVDGSGAYNTCKTLIYEAGTPHPETALLQLNRIWGIPMDKLVLGRPAGIHGSHNDVGQMSVDAFAKCLGEAFFEGWNGGVSWRHHDGSSIESVLEPMLDQVRHYHHRKEHTDGHHIHAPKQRRARHAARAKQLEHPV